MGEKVGFIGGFPPPYGGVTIKNKLLYDNLKDQCSIVIFNSRGISNYARLFFSVLLTNKPYIIGVSASRGKSLLVTKILYFVNKNSMKKSLYFMMGGVESDRIANSLNEVKMYSFYKKIYVESEQMRNILLDAGLSNVEYYPNGRVRISRSLPLNMSNELKCVFFSSICEMKGCMEIIEAAKKCPSVLFYFYGFVNKEFQKYFYENVESLPNVYYKGVFQGSNLETYVELSEYDVLLLPTKYTTEGVPGIIVEAKICGLSIIASGNSHNKELIINNEEGLILKENNTDELFKAIQTYDKDRSLLQIHKENSKKSAERFYIDNYIGNIKKQLNLT